MFSCLYKVLEFNKGRYYLIMFLLFCSFTFAQKQANIWNVFDNTILDFNYNPPKLSTNILYHQNSPWNSFASICDNKGDLLFYTDGANAWNSKNEILFNGESLFNNSFPSYIIIVPQPGSEGLFYIFTTYTYYQSTPKIIFDTLFYTKVSVKSPTDKGTIIQRNRVLHTN